MPLVARACESCGREFLIGRRGRKYCSAKCRERRWNVEASVSRRLDQTETKACRNCGKEFASSDRRKVFCSAQCNVSYQNAKRKTTKTEKRSCPVCQTEFRPMQKRGVGRTYCSQSCRSKAAYQRNRPHAPGRHLEWRKAKKWGGNWWAALQRDRFTCQVCGVQSYPSQWRGAKSRLVVHHLDGTGERETKNHEIDNLMTVCDPCHRLFHSGVDLVRIDGEWKLRGAIIDRLGLTWVPAIGA